MECMDQMTFLYCYELTLSYTLQLLGMLKVLESIIHNIINHQ